MKKRMTTVVLAIALFAGTVAGAGITGAPDAAAKKTTKQVKSLNTLNTALKKKKKKTISKTYKTERGGTANKKNSWLKHKAAIQAKGKKIIFTDTVYVQDSWRYDGKVNTDSKYTIKMVMKIGNNKKVTISSKGSYKDEVYDKATDKWVKKWVNEKTIKTSFKPASYKKGISLKWTKGADVSDYMDEYIFTTFRCWNSLAKKCKVSMKAIGFTKYKPVSIENEAYYR